MKQEPETVSEPVENRNIVAVDFETLKYMDIPDPSLYDVIGPCSYLYATIEPTDDGVLVATSHSEIPECVVYREGDTCFFIRHGGIIIPSSVSLGHLISATGLPVGLFTYRPGGT